MKKQGKHLYRDNEPMTLRVSARSGLIDELQRLILKKDRHPVSPGEIEALDEAWRKRWPTVFPVAHTRRMKQPDTTIRFHSLPGSRGWVVTQGQFDELMSRHFAMIADLTAISDVSSEDLFLIIEDWSSDVDHAGRTGSGLNVEYSDAPRGLKYPKGGLGLKFPRGSLWMATRNPESDMDDDENRWLNYYVIRVGLNSDILRVYLELLARDLIRGWMICPPGAEWIYSPYEVGMDVFPATEADRDLLRSRYPAWLPIGTSADTSE